MIVGEPSQERLAFERFIRRHGGAGSLNLTERLVDLRYHFLPVGYGAAHIPERSRQTGGERGYLIRRDDPIDLDVHERFRADSLAWRREHLLNLSVGAPPRHHNRMNYQVK